MGIEDFNPGALYYRAVNNHPLQTNELNGGMYNVQNFSDFFRNEKNYSFYWLFVNNANSDAFDTVLKDMPLGLIKRTMINLARPIYTDFTEINKEEEFSRVSADFYRELFWLEKIYVSHDIFANPDSYIYEGKDEPKELKHLARRGGFDLWIKLTGDDLDDDIGFMHIKTGIVVQVPEWWDKMAIAEWCGDRIENFVNWFEYSIEWLAGLKKIDKFSRLLTKRVRADTSGKKNVTEAIDDMKAKLSTIENLITVDPKNNVDISVVEFASGADLQSLHYTTFNTLDRKAYELGRVSNTNPRGERLTTGENYKDISSIANRQKATLERLEEFANQVKNLFAIELSFAVSGLPEREKLPMESPEAPNPNSEGMRVI